jgi:hypothetical protein
MHKHTWTKWIDIGAAETNFYQGGAIIQTSHCETCGKRRLRKTNSVTGSGVAQVYHMLIQFLNRKDR